MSSRHAAVSVSRSVARCNANANAEFWLTLASLHRNHWPACRHKSPRRHAPYAYACVHMSRLSDGKSLSVTVLISAATHSTDEPFWTLQASSKRHGVFGASAQSHRMGAGKQEVIRSIQTSFARPLPRQCPRSRGDACLLARSNLAPRRKVWMTGWKEDSIRAALCPLPEIEN